MSRRSRCYGLVERVVDRRPCVAHHLHDALVHLPGALVMTSSTFRGASSSEVAFHEPPAMAGEAAAKRRVLSHLADLEAQIKLANQENESLRAQRKAERRAADQRAESVMAVLGAKDAELVSMGKELERVAKMETSGRHAVAEKRAQIRDLRSQIVEAEAEQRVSFIFFISFYRMTEDFTKFNVNLIRLLFSCFSP